MPTFRRAPWSLSIGICALAWVGACATPAQASAPSAPTPEQLEQSCGQAVAASCLSLGLLFEEGGAGVSRDESRAARLYEQACTAGERRGCNNLGILYEEGRGVAKDPRQAAGFYEKACDADYSQACFNLGSLYLYGVGVAKDARRAVRLLDRACKDNQAEACFRLGMLYRQGTGIERDERKARAHFNFACALGDARACPPGQASAQAQAAVEPEPRPKSDEGARFSLVLTLGAQIGGEELVSARSSDGETSSLNAGDALSIAVGGLLEPWGGDFHVLQLQATVGYHFTRIDASNASAKLKQVPVELLAFYRYRPYALRIGGGLQYQTGASFESEGLGLISPVSFGNALGVVIQTDWVPYEFFTVYARYTLLSYSPPLLSEGVAGGGFGFGLSFSPRLL